MKVIEAFKKQKNNKAPGQDGIPVEYYKTFEEILQILFKRLMEEIWGTGLMPKTWNEAVITLIHKPNTDKMEKKNYRPVSLLNVTTRFLPQE